ncbi:MAG: putative metal-binding motif-containing protein [Myxococcaceae bacterium]|nr:putative metal-binding motif-containing protein [Myxococcaceae bacterium]
MRRAWWVVLAVGCSASVPGLQVQAVEPRSIFQQADTRVLLRGAFPTKVKVDFEAPGSSTREALYTAQLERELDVIGLFDVRLEGPTTLSARVPSGVLLGPWAVRVTDPFGRQVRLDEAVDVVDCSQLACVLEDGGVLDAGPALLPDGGSAGGGDAGADAGEEEGDAGPPDAGPQPCGQLTFADDDLDGFGRPDSGAMLCGSGRAPMAGDCDDVDPGTFPGATEFCNRGDDDCDGRIDEGVCPVLNPNWIRRLDTGGADKTWATVAPFGVGRVWIGGNDDVWVRADGGFFEDVSGSCPNDIGASWAAPSGEAFFAGGNPALGRLTSHAVGSGGCSSTRMLSDPVAGLIGGLGADGGLVTVGALRNARFFEWQPPGQPAESSSNLPSSVRFEDAHAQGLDSFYAVGSDTATNRMGVYRYDANARVWVAESLPSRLALPAGRLRGVWVRSAGNLFAVGDEGVVLEKRDGRWLRVPAPSSSAVTAVRAFNGARLYVTQLEGAVRKWNGRAWQTVYATDAGVQFFDIGGVSESDLWAVGSRGFVLHWAE